VCWQLYEIHYTKFAHWFQIASCNQLEKQNHVGSFYVVALITLHSHITYILKGNDLNHFHTFDSTLISEGEDMKTESIGRS